MNRRRGFRIVGIAALILAVAGGIFIFTKIPAAGWTVNDVTTGTSAAYPKLVPHTYDMPPDQTLEVAAAVATRLPHWHVTQTDLAGGSVKATVKHALGLLPNDVTVTVTPVGRNAQVTIHSQSNYGAGDLGLNAANIRALQHAMDDRLNVVTASSPAAKN